MTDTCEACTALVFVRDNTVLVNSQDVAENFGKRHNNVLAAIDDLDCSDEFRLLNFKQTCEIKDIGTSRRSVRSYDMTRDGFVFLVMGFTGSSAARFKEAYIAAFNAMEAELRERQEEPVTTFTPEAEARQLVGQTQRTFGVRAAQQMWFRLGLPVVPAMLAPPSQMELAFAR